MNRTFTVLLAGLALSGCVHRHVTVVEESAYPEEPVAEEVYVDEGPDVVVVEECDPVWDGHTWVYVESHVHGSGCGHYFHHGCWHLHPIDWIYVDVGWCHFGDTGGFVYCGEPWARVWDGLVFLMLRGHVHGPGCGHFYHHGCWNTCESGTGWTDPHRRHYSTAPPRRHTETLAAPGGGRGVVRVVAPEGRRTGTAPETATEAGPSRRGRSSSRLEAPGAARRETPARPEVRPERPAGDRTPPRRVDAPERREAPPRRIETPERREAPPRRIETPERREAPPRKIETPERREAPPRKIETPPRRIESPGRKEAPPKKEEPKRKDPPREKDRPKDRR